jgi:hypothetical protein
MADGPGIRSFTTQMAHRPLRNTYGERFLYVLGLMLDYCVEKLNQGEHDHMCTECDPSALQYIGAERGIVRGLTESDDSYAARLQRALDDLALAGNPWSVLGQVLGYVLEDTPRALTVQSIYTAAGVLDSSTWDYYNAGADTTKAPQHLYDGTGNWDWDSLSPTTGSWGWWRWYLVVSAVAPNDWVTKKGKWGSSGKWASDGWAWGVEASSNVGRSIRIIVKQWKAAHSWCHWIMITFDDALFLPTSAVNAGVNPDGHFGRWSKISGGVYVRARYSNVCYFTGPT